MHNLAQGRAHKALGLVPGATEREVVVAYRRLARTYHPDVAARKRPDLSPHEARRRFTQVGAAYELLLQSGQLPRERLGTALGGRTLPIHEAARAGDTARIRELVAADAGIVHVLDAYGLDALAWAITGGHTSAVRALLQLGAGHAFGATPLAGGDTAEERKRAPATDCRDDDGPSGHKKEEEEGGGGAGSDGASSHSSSAAGHGSAVGPRRAIAIPASATAKSARRVESRVVPAAHTAVASEQCPALVVAAGRGETAIVEALLAAGGDADAVEPILGHGPLHRAAEKGRLEVVRRLVPRVRDVDAADKRGYRALHVACFNGHAEVVAALLDAGADTVATAEGDTPMGLAARKARLAVVELLLARRVPVDEGALAYARERGHGDVLATLSRARHRR